MVNQGEIEKRLDADFYLPLYRTNLDRIKQTSYPITKLNNLTTSIINGLDTRNFYEEGSIPYIRVANVKENYIDFTKIKFLKENSSKKPITLDAKTDFLMTRKGTFGVASSIQSIHQNAVISSEVFKITVNTDLLYPSYFAIYINTDTVQYYIKSIATGAIMGHLSQEVLKEIPVVRPPKAVQADIVALMETAYATKRQKEAEAQALLASIDAYVLEKLGITLPTLEKRQCFSVMSSTVEGSRLDSRYYQAEFLAFLEMLSQKQPCQSLGVITDYIGSGSTPTAGGEAYTENPNEGVPFIRVTNLEEGTISLENVLFVNRNIHETLLKRTQLQGGDVLLSMAGTIGLSVVVPEWLAEGNINQALAKIVLKEFISPFYVSSILNSTIGKIQTDRLSRPSVQANLNLEEIAEIQIPLPPKAVQDEIATAVQHRMATAKQLKAEAKQALETAKHQVEALLFGA